LKKTVTLLTIILLGINGYSQNQRKIDSLLTVLKTVKEDTSKVYTLIAISKEKTNAGEYQEAKNFGEEALSLAEKIGFENGMAASFYRIGIIYALSSDFKQALENDKKALAIYEQLGDKVNIGVVSGTIGNICYSLTDYGAALEYEQKALTIFESIQMF